MKKKAKRHKVSNNNSSLLSSRHVWGENPCRDIIASRLTWSIRVITSSDHHCRIQIVAYSNDRTPTRNDLSFYISSRYSKESSTPSHLSSTFLSHSRFSSSSWQCTSSIEPWRDENSNRETMTRIASTEHFVIICNIYLILLPHTYFLFETLFDSLCFILQCIFCTCSVKIYNDSGKFYALSPIKFKIYRWRLSIRVFSWCLKLIQVNYTDRGRGRWSFRYADKKSPRKRSSGKKSQGKRSPEKSPGK